MKNLYFEGYWRAQIFEKESSGSARESVQWFQLQLLNHTFERLYH